MSVNIKALLSGDKWNSSTITYSFFDGGSYYGSGIISELSNPIKNTVRNILENYIEPLINVNFVEVSDAGNNYGQIRYMFSSKADYAHAYYPSSWAIGGDVHLNPAEDHSFDSNGFRGGLGTHGFMSLIHETLHALGLKHPGDYTDVDTYPFLPYGQDNTTNTVMTYNFTGNSAATPMPFDIKALQHLYGAKSHNAGNTTYSFDTVYGYSDGSQYRGSATTPTKLSIWDSGGTDTLNFSSLAFRTSGYRFDLKEGGMLTSQNAYNATSYRTEDRRDTVKKLYYTSTFGTAIAYDAIIENAIGSSSNDKIYGNTAKNVLRGAKGNDYLWSSAGNDYLYGNSGKDTLSGGSGNDYLDGGIENDQMYGSTGKDTLTGGAGNDYLDGGTGNDRMYGGTGNDNFVVNSTGDVITEYTNQGIDRVYSSISYHLGNNLENLSLTGRAYYGYGNSLNNSISGNTTANVLLGAKGNDYLWSSAGNDYLYGNSGKDTLSGGSGNDYLYGGIENDQMYGSTGNDTLSGSSGNDYLDGGTGNNQMYGGTGNDNFVVNSTGDVITEYTNQGIDRVYSSISYRLGNNLENLSLRGSAYYGHGNSLNNSISGNRANNHLWSSAGDDSLYGNVGNDALSGGSGNDYLDGGTGNDQMYGGTGNDRFVVNSTGDVVTEYANQGSDRVYSSISYSLGNNLENLSLTGSAYYGYGNSLNNSISGNSSNNYLWGSSGNDYLYGNAGNDYLSGGTGNDRMYGGTGDDTLTGSSGNDYLSGWSGNDTLVGGFGNDTLTGGSDADKFAFNFRSEGIDTITDFSRVQGDKIQVSASGFGGGLNLGILRSYYFTTGSAASDTSDRFIYNSSTGGLFFDVDGTGSSRQVQFATLSSGLNLTSNDFIVV